MLKAIILFILGLALLIKGGDFFVSGSSSLAHKLHIPEIIIGATIVSIGTTLPEVMVSATSAVEGHGEIAYGNAIGSIICNTSLIAALTLIASSKVVDRKSLILPSIFFFIAACIYVILSYTTGFFPRWSGIVLLVLFIAYIFLVTYKALKNRNNVKSEEITNNENKGKDENIYKIIFLVIIGAAFIAYGANLLVDNGIIIAKELGVSEAVIALTFVALGTSLPELVTAITAIIKKHSSLSVGNVIGANLFNLVLVSGLSITLSPFSIPNNTQIGGINSTLLIDIPVMILVMLLLLIPALIKGKLYKVQGFVLLSIYVSFCVLTFVL